MSQIKIHPEHRYDYFVIDSDNIVRAKFYWPSDAAAMCDYLNKITPAGFRIAFLVSPYLVTEIKPSNGFIRIDEKLFQVHEI